jgi:hypothetical protein
MPKCHFRGHPTVLLSYQTPFPLLPLLSLSSPRIEKEFISDLKLKNPFFLKEIGDSSYGDQWEMQYQNKFRMELFQMAEITAE